MTILDGAASPPATTAAVTPPAAATIAAQKPAERSITFRSLLVGTLCVIAVCAATLATIHH